MVSSSVHPFLMQLLQQPEREGRMRPVLNEEDWGRILSDADVHGLTSLLYQRLKQADPAYRPPASQWQELRDSAHRIAANNLSFLHEFSTILHACQDRGMDCIPLRGLALAEQLNGTLTTRPMNDLDFLVHRGALSLMAETLTALGYQEIDRRPGFARTFSYTLEFVKKGVGWPLVEPHWTIAYPPFADRVDMGAVWQRAVPGTVGGVDTLLLSRTDLLLHLCFHLLHKGEQAPLLWWYELALVIRQEPDALDWTQVLHIAGQSGQGELLAGLLSKLHALFGSPIPAPIFAQLKAPSESASRNFLHRRLTSLLRGDSGVDGRESLAHLLTMKGFQAKWRYACGILFPSSEFMRAHYGLSGRPWLGFRYMARLLYFLWEGGKGLVGLVAIRPTPRQSPPR